MALGRLQRGEVVAVVGGILLAIGVFLSWYHLANHRASLNGHHGAATFSAWDAHPIVRWLLLAAAVAPLILAWIIANDYALSWPRGQLTSVVSIAALGIMFYIGVIDRPGDPRSLVTLRYGWFVAMAGAILMLVGSVMRQQETEIRRKPPGTL